MFSVISTLLLSLLSPSSATLDAPRSLSVAWERSLAGTAFCLWSHLLPSSPPPSLLLQGTLLTSCTCSVFSELPFSAQLNTLTEGASVHLPVPRSLEGILTTSWFRGYDAQPAAMIFSPEGLPGPAHTGREILGTQGSLVLRNVTAQDSGSYTVVLETSRGRRSATKQIHVKSEWGPTVGGIDFSESRPTGPQKSPQDTFCAGYPLLPIKPPQNLKRQSLIQLDSSCGQLLRCLGVG